MIYENVSNLFQEYFLDIWSNCSELKFPGQEIPANPQHCVKAPDFSKLWLTHCELEWSNQSQGWAKAKVVKWRQKSYLSISPIFWGRGSFEKWSVSIGMISLWLTPMWAAFVFRFSTGLLISKSHWMQIGKRLPLKYFDSISKRAAPKWSML